MHQSIVDLNFEKQDSYDYFTENILSWRHVTNIRSLKLNDSFQIHHFLSTYSLDSLKQLQFLSLKFRFSNDKTPFQFWNQLSSLKYLHSLEIIHYQRYFDDYNYEDKNLIFNSIFNENCCTSLKSLIIRTNGQHSKSSIPPLITTSHIEYLSINVSFFEDLVKLFFALQYLKSFHIDFEFSLDPNYDKHVTIPTSLLPNCIHLHLRLSPQMSFKHIKYILRQTPHLRYLVLFGQKYLLKAKRWENLLSLYCPYLVKFKFICANFIYDEDYRCDFNRLIDNFEEQSETPYWMERNFTTSYFKLPFSEDDYRRDIAVKNPIVYSFSITTTCIVITNILNVIVLCRRVLRSSSCAYYFLAAIPSVLLYLIASPINAILQYSLDFSISSTPITCKLVTFLAYATSLWYGLMLVCASIDRYLCSSTSVRLRHLSRIYVARRIIIVVWIVALIYMSPFLVIYYYDPRYPDNRRCTQYYSTTLTTIYLITRVTLHYILIPILLSIFGALTIYNIRGQKNRVIPINQTGFRRRRESQLARMLIIQVAVYLLFFTPSAIAYILITFISSMNTPFYITIRNLAIAWQQGGFFIPFFLYILTGKIYREEVKKMFKCDRI
ncbi:hypothetical protein I4U23_011568 [Adineta vaga]|nr:hypothetical protein I4U23_011568 [Adineta vaga]